MNVSIPHSFFQITNRTNFFITNRIMLHSEKKKDRMFDKYIIVE